MAELSIRPVETRSEQKRFVRLPWRIYRDDPCWMPPLVMSQEELLGFRPHPFYERSTSRSFLATRGGRDVGRITAIEASSFKPGGGPNNIAGRARS